MSIPALVEPADDLVGTDVRRLAHQLILDGHGALGQRRLANSRVLVIGADEIGAPALALLADSGVGRIGIIDGAPLREWDRWLGLPAPVGPSGGVTRAAAWAAALHGTHPSLRTVVHEAPLDAANADAVVRGYDVVLCASEDPARCVLVDDACAQAGRPFVWGGMADGVGGRVGVFWDAHGPTYRDLYPKPPAPYFRGVAGALKVVAAVLAATMAAETVKLITGCGEPLVGRVLEYSAAEGSCAVVPLRRCPTTERPARLTAGEPFFGLLSPEAAEAARESTISVEELDGLLRDGSGICLVDVREPEEYAFVNIPGSLLIPKREFLEGDAAGRLPADRKIVLLCLRGIRSAEALAVVKRHGHRDAVHVGGGIVAWADRIDPGLPAYW